MRNKDSLGNSANGVTIYGGEGKDIIFGGPGCTLSLRDADADDTIKIDYKNLLASKENSANGVTIHGGEGKDIIFGGYRCELSLRDADDDNDTISLSGGYSQ